MGKKGGWFSSIKKTLSPSSKEKKSQKSEKKEFSEEHVSVPDTSVVINAGGSYDSHPFPPPEEVNPIEVEVEPPQVASGPSASSTAVAATTTRYSGKSREEVAAIRIQTVFRGYLARRGLCGLQGLVRLKTVIEGPSVKRQTVNTLKCTQTLSHLQSQINSRRIRMSEENQAIQRQLRAKEIANMQNGDEWNDSVQSKEEIEAKLLSSNLGRNREEDSGNDHATVKSGTNSIPPLQHLGQKGVVVRYHHANPSLVLAYELSVRALTLAWMMTLKALLV